jgi:hypothetical protein
VIASASVVQGVLPLGVPPLKWYRLLKFFVPPR